MSEILENFPETVFIYLCISGYAKMPFSLIRQLTEIDTVTNTVENIGLWLGLAFLFEPWNWLLKVLRGGGVRQVIIPQI